LNHKKLLKISKVLKISTLNNLKTTKRHFVCNTYSNV